MTIAVRRIEPDEWRDLRATRLAALLDAPSAFAMTYAEESQYPEQHWIDAARDRSSGSHMATFAAVDEAGDWVALVGGYRPQADAPVAELVSMWVAPAGRRSGLARRLVQAVIDWAAEVGCDAVELWVTQGNERAFDLYRDAGFEETGDFVPLPSDPCQDEVRMRKSLG